jgi:hypothetical protein
LPQHPAAAYLVLVRANSVRTFFSVAFVSLFVGSTFVCASDDCPSLPDSQIKLPSGQWICALHHKPILKAEAFWLPRPLPIIDFMGETARVSHCNPNSLFPYASLRRTKEFSVPGPAYYCPTCEQAMLAADKRAQAYFTKHHGYPP